MEPIEYQLTEEDLMRSHMFYSDWSGELSAIQKSIRGLQVLLVALFASLLYIEEVRIPIVVLLTAGVVLHILYPWILKRTFRKRFQQQARGQGGYLLDGPITVAVEDDGLSVASSLGGSLYYYPAVTDVLKDSNATYLIIGKARTLILPHDRIGKETVDAFVSEVERRREVPAGAETPEDVAPLGGDRP
jgi:hypothetical protein